MLPGWQGVGDTLGTLLLEDNVISDVLPVVYDVEYSDASSGIFSGLNIYVLFGAVVVTFDNYWKRFRIQLRHTGTHQLGMIDRIE